MRQGFPGGSVVKNPRAMQEIREIWVWSLGRDDPLEEGIATHSGTEEPGRLYSPWGHKELDTTEGLNNNKTTQ